MVSISCSTIPEGSWKPGWLVDGGDEGRVVGRERGRGQSVVPTSLLLAAFQGVGTWGRPVVLRLP